MKELNRQSYKQNRWEIMALENAINYIKLSSKEYSRLERKIYEKENKNKGDKTMIGFVIGINLGFVVALILFSLFQ